MIYKVLKILYLIIVISFCTLRVEAQRDTSAPLFLDLKRFYNAGKYYDARRVAEQLCQNTKLSQEDNAELMKYYSAVLKESGFDERADSVTKGFIKKNPFYKVKSEDPVPFQEMFSNYYAYPKFSVAFSVGICSPEVTVDTVHIIGVNTQTDPVYEESIGFTAGLSLQYYPLKQFSITCGLKYYFSQWQREVRYQGERRIFVYQESSHVIAVPVYAGYAFDLRKWTPEVFLGAELDYIVKARYETYNEYNGIKQDMVVQKNLDLNSKNRVNYSLDFGFRISRNYNRIAFFADMFYAVMLRPFNRAEYNYSDNNLFYNKLFVHDAIRLRLDAFSLGIKVNFGYAVKAKYGYGY